MSADNASLHLPRLLMITNSLADRATLKREPEKDLSKPVIAAAHRSGPVLLLHCT